MANENNKLNDLVAEDDDDPTVELEIPVFRFHGHEDGELEADARTYNAREAGDESVLPVVGVPDHQADVESRNETISRLQYDIEQLHSKWLGLEQEIKARESLTDNLNSEVKAAQSAASRKEKLIKKRDQRIKSLKVEIRQREEDLRQLAGRFDESQQQLEAERAAAAETAELRREQVASEYLVQELRERLQRSEEYADTIRHQLQDMIEANNRSRREWEDLTSSLAEVSKQNADLKDEMQEAAVRVDEMQSDLESVHEKHQEEIRILRFELGSAQDTVAESQGLNDKLASELVDAHGFKEELERLLGESEKQGDLQIEALQKEISDLKQAASNYEQKLATKTEAITVLLAELAKKTEQLESIGEIEDVIQDIDERMSERSTKSAAERVTRVLIGNVDGQVLRFPLFKDRLSVGRTEDNDIQLKAAYVSRRHALIQTEIDQTKISDWGSKNGVYVNSERISEQFLRHGDTVTIGNARFRYEERRKREA